MCDKPMRDKNILDEGIRHHEKVIIDDLWGKVVGVDFNAQTIRIEINVPAHRVVREPEANSKMPEDPAKNALNDKD